MRKPEDMTFSVPRFLSFIDLAYLFEAAKVADEHFASKVTAAKDRNAIGNINATRQSLLRAVFLGSYAILEQNLDELMNMEQERNKVSLSPADLKDRGITRSLTYAKKVLNKNIDTSLAQWKELFLLQEVRNHLVHYGPTFSDASEHNRRFDKFTNSEYVTLRPEICFTLHQIERIFDLYMECVDNFSK
jgi:hypothetical protein